jgi:uncharacterized protein (TIGR03000 family)
MLVHKLVRMGLPLAAVMAVILAARPATAQQQGWPLTQGSYNGFTESRSTYTPAYNEAAPTYVAPATVLSGTAAAQSGQQTEVRSFYPSAAGETYGALSGQAQSNRAVRINVTVPANAEILFGNFKTTQSGAQRAFVSPPLDRGRDFTYDITAKWQEGDRQVVRTRHVTVHAGDVVNLSF